MLPPADTTRPSAPVAVVAIVGAVPAAGKPLVSLRGAGVNGRFEASATPCPIRARRPSW